MCLQRLPTQLAGLPFLDTPITRRVESDSSDFVWGGLDIDDGRRLVHAFWREVLHINVKELRAAIATIKSLAVEGDHVLLQVDNSVTYVHLLRPLGGREPPSILWFRISSGGVCAEVSRGIASSYLRITCPPTPSVAGFKTAGREAYTWEVMSS